MNFIQRLFAWLDRPSVTDLVEQHMVGCRCPRKGALVNLHAGGAYVTRCERHLPVDGWHPAICQHHAHTYERPTQADLDAATDSTIKGWKVIS
jgi:hypothetical protein